MAKTRTGGKRRAETAAAVDTDSNTCTYTKRSKHFVSAAAAELKCPITDELPLDPVFTEAGDICERKDIERLIKIQGDNLRSPGTNKPMGKNLFPAVRVRNTIDFLVESGAIAGDLAGYYKERKLVLDTTKRANDEDADAMQMLAKWYRKGKNGLPKDEGLANKWLVRSKKTRAEKGDVEAMNCLGDWYWDGSNDLPKNMKKAFQWYKKSADLNDTKGMADAGECLVTGCGVAKNIGQGAALTGFAAGMGSDLACYNMGSWYWYGEYGMPKDRVQSKYWLKKVVDGSCTVQHMCEDDVKHAREFLEALTGEKKD